MITLVQVVGAVPLGGHRLRIAFSDGTEGEQDFAPMIRDGGPMVEPLADERVFARVFVELGTLAWPNGLDLDSIALHAEMKEAGRLRRRAA